MNLPLNIALTGVKTGLDIAAKATKAGDGKDALQSVFASLLALASQAIGKPETGKTEVKPGETGSIAQSAANWLQAQLGGAKITLDGETLTINGKSVNAKDLLAQLLGGSKNLDILGADILGTMGQLGANGANQPDGQFAKMLQSSGAYQAMVKASAGVSSAMNALPATSAAKAIADQAAATIFADNAKAAKDIATSKPAPTIAANETGTQLSKAQLAQLALPTTATSPVAAPGASLETSLQSANNPLIALAQNQNGVPLAKQALANKQASQTPANAPQISQAVPQLSQADALAAQIQNQLSPIAESKSNKKTRPGLGPQNSSPLQPGANPSNPAITPFQILQAKAIAASNSNANAQGLLDGADVSVDSDATIKAVQNSATMAQASATQASATQASASKGQINAFSPLQAGLQAPQINLPNVAFEIARNLNGGNNRFQIRLDPPELGRIDVRLEVKKDGTTNARLTVDRQDTLDLLQRDARALQRALVQAGLDSSQTNLEFSLKQNPFAGQGFSGKNSSPQFENAATPGNGETTAPPDQVISAYRGYISPGGVSMWV